jgi:hypothetical protein
MPNNLFDKAVLLSVTIGSLGTRRKVNSSAVEVDADKDMISVSKAILDSELFDAIRKFDGKTRGWIAERSLPSMFKSGIYLWPITLVESADNYLIQRQAERQVLIDTFIAALPNIYADSQERLRDLWNPQEFPSEAKIRAAFTQEYRFIECSTPGRLKSINPAIFAREAEKAASQWSNALDEAKDILRVELANLVEHMRDRMQPGTDGKPKRFKKSMVENFQTFLELFDARNIADDTQLKAVVEQCKATMQGINADNIRDNDGLRSTIAASMDAIKTGLAPLVTVQGRQIDIGEADTIEPEAEVQAEPVAEPKSKRLFDFGDDI